MIAVQAAGVGVGVAMIPFAGWWMEKAGMVMTVATDNRTSEPVQL